jgi:hypothetical protein
MQLIQHPSMAVSKTHLAPPISNLAFAHKRKSKAPDDIRSIHVLAIIFSLFAALFTSW